MGDFGFCVPCSWTQLKYNHNHWRWEVLRRAAEALPVLFYMHNVFEYQAQIFPIIVLKTSVKIGPKSAKIKIYR